MSNASARPIIGSALAGAGVGMLVGIAAGLSSAPVIAVVVGAISAGLLILLGLKKSDPPPAEATADSSSGDHAVARIAAFGFVCTLALIGGVTIRAHDLLAPSAKSVEQTWKDAGFSDEQARQIALYQKVGLSFGKGDGKDGGLVESRPGSAASESSVLFATRSGSPCPYFSRKNYANTEDMLKAMELQGGDLQKFAIAVEALGSNAQRDQVVDAAGGVICGQ